MLGGARAGRRVHHGPSGTRAPIRAFPPYAAGLRAPSSNLPFFPSPSHSFTSARSSSAGFRIVTSPGAVFRRSLFVALLRRAATPFGSRSRSFHTHPLGSAVHSFGFPPPLLPLLLPLHRPRPIILNTCSWIAASFLDHHPTPRLDRVTEPDSRASNDSLYH